MSFLLHDISKISVSFFKIATGTFGIANKIFKKHLSIYLKNNNFVTQNEFEALNNSVKELISRQNKIEERLSQK